MRRLFIFFGLLLCTIPAYGQCSSTAYGTATCIQAGANNNGGAANTVTVTMGSTLGAGHTYKIWALFCSNTTCTTATNLSTTLSDNGCGETYWFRPEGSSDLIRSGNESIQEWEVYSSKGGCTQITATETGAFYLSLVVTEWSGPAAFEANPSFDQGGTVNTTCGSCASATTFTTVASSELVCTAGGNAGNATPTWTSPTTAVATGAFLFVGCKTVSSTGQVGNAWTLTSQSNWMTVSTFTLVSPPCAGSTFGTATCNVASSNQNTVATSGAAVSISAGKNYSAGHRRIVYAWWCLDSLCGTNVSTLNASITDNGCSETYHTIPGAGLTGSGIGIEAFQVYGATGGCDRTTASVSGGFFVGIAVVDFSGSALFEGSTALDQTNSSALAACSTCAISTSGSISVPNELVCGIMTPTGANIVTGGASSSVIVGTNLSCRAVSAIAIQSISMTTSGSATTPASLETFELAAAGSGVPRRR